MISDEIDNLELEIAFQMYRERVDCLDERLHEFRQSQEIPHRQGMLVMDAFYFVESFQRGSLCIHNNHNIALFIAMFQCVYSVFHSYMLCFNLCLYAFHSVYVDDNR